MKVLLIRKGAKLPREVGFYNAWTVPAEEYRVRSRKLAEATMAENLPTMNASNWVDRYNGVAIHDVYCCIPDGLYYTLTSPETNEYGEVSP